MIEFKHKLPAMNIDGKQNGTYNNIEAGFPGIFTTTDFKLGEFLYKLRNVIWEDRRLVFIDKKYLVCYNCWIRDHVHHMKGFKHWEYDLNSYLDFTVKTQRNDGQYYELIKQMDDVHWSFVDEDCRVFYDKDNVALVRLELEADVEYLVIEGAVEYYKATGDIAWIKQCLPSFEKSIDYITSDAKRWDKEHELVKRPFTIDTWDFTYGKVPQNRKIEDDTPMSVMHGDNSGVYQAMKQLAWLNRILVNPAKAQEWETRADNIKENMFKYLWNGRFFMHQLHLNHNGADNLESERLSLSNTYDINRGVTNLGQSRSIIEEYIKRRETTNCFAEWFSIDPPYSEFAGHKAGTYVNGALSPFTAGELAKAAFNNGYERYGWDIIARFIKLMERDNTIYFLYSPEDGTQQGGGPSAWGAAALLSAVDEGLAGIVDAGVKYNEIEFSPRFVVTDYTELRYTTGYETSKVMVDVRFILEDNGMRYDIDSPADKIKAHILLPDHKTCKKMYVNGVEKEFNTVRIADSVYADIEVKSNGRVSFELLF